MHISARRMRTGILLWLLSWFPIPAILVALMVGHHRSVAAESAVYWVSCGVLWLVGFVGIYLAGKETIAVVRATGARKAPRAVWQVLRTGTIPDGASSDDLPEPHISDMSDAAPTSRS